MLDPIEVPRSLIERFLAKFIPEADELIQMMKADVPGDGLTPKLRQILKNLNVRNWAVLYQDPINDLKAKLLVMRTPDEISAFNARFLGMTPEEQSRAIAEIIEESIDSADEEEFEDEEVTQTVINAMTDDERSEYFKRIQMSLSFLIPTLFNYFSLMVHRKSIYQLVSEAMAGDDTSFLKAIQIDKTVLTDIPYFAERNRRTADEGDFNFQRQINTYRNKPIFLSRPRYPMLWLVLACLDEMNILDQFEKDKEKLLDLCQGLGVYGPKDDSADVFSFEKRLREYKKDQDRKLPRPAQRLIVKDATSSN